MTEDQSEEFEEDSKDFGEMAESTDASFDGFIKNTVDQTEFKDFSNMFIARHLHLFEDGLDTEQDQRPRGILSNTDRDYLFGFKDYAHEQSEANRRQDIRKRVEHSLKDFKILWAMLDDIDRNQIFRAMGEEEVNECVEAMITFVYAGFEKDVPRLEQAIERGLLAAEQATTGDKSVGTAKNIDVSIEIDSHPDPDAVYEKLQTEPISQLTVEEIGVLAKAGKLDPEDIQRLNEDGIYAPPGYFGEMDDEPTVEKDPVHYDTDLPEDSESETDKR